MAEPFKAWQCRTCGYIYDESLGDPAEGLAAGTRWADIPETWICPLCGTPKRDFDMVEL
jgi:rubredoxin